MSATVQHSIEGWTATVEDGEWASREPGMASVLAALTADHGYLPDRDWSLALLATQIMPNLRLVGAPPAPELDPAVDY